MSCNSSMPQGSAPSENRSSCSCSAVKESAEITECSYLRCKRPVYSDGKSWSNGQVDNVKLQRPAFCGLFHRDLYFSDLLERKKCPSAAVEGPSTSLAFEDTDLGITPKCMLPECSRDVCMDVHTGFHFDFCGKRHMLAMRPLLVKKWSLEGTLCNLGECVRHVWVEDDGSAYDFCSMSHATLAAAKKGLPIHDKSEKSTAGVEPAIVEHGEVAVPAARGQWTNERPDEISPKSLHENEGYYDTINHDKLHRLLMGEPASARGIDVPQGIDIYQFHPWELLDPAKRQPRYFLYRVCQDSQKTLRSTKDGYAWKQNGPGHPGGHLNASLVTTYFHYQHTREKRKKGDDKDHSDTMWKMHEMRLDESGSRKSSRIIIWKIWEHNPCLKPRKKPRGKLAENIPRNKFRKGGDSNDVRLEKSKPEAVVFQNSDVSGLEIEGADGPLFNETQSEEKGRSALPQSATSGQSPWAENSDVYNPLAVNQRGAQDFDMPGDASRNNGEPEAVVLEIPDVLGLEIDGADGLQFNDIQWNEKSQPAFIQSAGSGQPPWEQNSNTYDTLQPVLSHDGLEDLINMLKDSDNPSETDIYSFLDLSKL